MNHSKYTTRCIFVGTAACMCCSIAQANDIENAGRYQDVADAVQFLVKTQVSSLTALHIDTQIVTTISDEGSHKDLESAPSGG